MIFPNEVRSLPPRARPGGVARPAVFFDRDDTLIRNTDLPAEAFAGTRGDLADPRHVRLLPGAAEACRAARAAGFAVVVVTNQGVVARGGATLADVEATCDRMVELIEVDAGPGTVNAVLACPFHPRGTVPAFAREHPWRKPAPGMLQAARDLLGLDLESSWMVGDAERDIAAAVAAGLSPERCVRVGEGAANLREVTAQFAERAAHG
ncbi:MAG: HAD-IIIA family hydrolase [Planctomycetota bacterium]